MRLSAHATALCLSAFCALGSFTQVSADDFGTLLDSLNFDGKASTSDNFRIAPARVANRQINQGLRPVPGQMVMPGNRLNSHSAALQTPVARSAHRSDGSDLQASAALRAMGARSGAIAADSVGHLSIMKNPFASGSDCDACDAPSMPKIRIPRKKCMSGGCGEILDPYSNCTTCERKPCFKRKPEEPKVCLPRREVNLPSSTFHQYFRSDRCYTNVWDGYSQECGKNHKHLHGTCDCHVKKKRKLNCGMGGGCEVLPPRQACNDCESCDGPCDG